MNRQEFMRRLEQLLEGIPEEENGKQLHIIPATLRMQEKKMKRR